jgi:hypothetical protein
MFSFNLGCCGDGSGEARAELQDRKIIIGQEE